MKNVWRGMMLGAGTGAVIGLFLDASNRVGQRAATVADHAAHSMKGSAGRGVRRIKEVITD